MTSVIYACRSAYVDQFHPLLKHFVAVALLLPVLVSPSHAQSGTRRVGSEKIGLTINGRAWKDWEKNHRQDLKESKLVFTGHNMDGRVKRIELVLKPNYGSTVSQRKKIELSGRWSHTFTLPDEVVYEVSAYWSDDIDTAPIGYVGVEDKLWLVYNFHGDHDDDDNDDDPPNNEPPTQTIGALGDLNLTITYPVDLLDLVGTTDGVLPAGTIFDLNSEGPGTVRIGFANSQGITGRHTLCRLDFRLKGKAGDQATLVGTATSAHRADTNQPVAIVVHNGLVVAAPDAFPGDYDGDGEITALDALAALRMSTRKLKPIDLIMDVDSDTAVTAKDARLLLGMAVAGTTSSGGGGTAGGAVALPQPEIKGPSVVIGSASKPTGEIVAIPVVLHYVPIVSGSTPPGNGGAGEIGNSGTGTPPPDSPKNETGSEGDNTSMNDMDTSDVVTDGPFRYHFEEPETIFVTSDRDLNDGQAPVWAPDGKSFVAVFSRGLKRIDAKTAFPEDIVTEDADAPSGVQFAPGAARIGLYPFVAGNMVAFLHPPSMKPQQLGSIYLSVPLSGGKPTPLMTLPILWNIVSVRGDQHREWLLCNFISYPRKQKLMITDSSPPDSANAKLYADLTPDATVAAVTSNWRLGALAEEYSRNAPFTWHIQTLPEGGRIATIPKSRGLGKVAFSPDGKYLAAVRHVEYDQEQIEVISLDDIGNNWVIAEAAADYSRPAWSPDGSRVAVCRYTKSPRPVFGRHQTERQMMVVQIGRKGSKPVPPKKDFATIEREFQVAQNRLHKLMAAGKGSTREAYEAHHAFMQISKLYNKAFEARGAPVSD